MSGLNDFVFTVLGCASGKEAACQSRTPEFDPWVRKIPWRKKWQPTPVIMPEKSHRQKSLAGVSPKELDTAEWHTQAFLSIIGATVGRFVLILGPTTSKLAHFPYEYYQYMLDNTNFISVLIPVSSNNAQALYKCSFSKCSLPGTILALELHCPYRVWLHKFTFTLIKIK